MAVDVEKDVFGLRVRDQGLRYLQVVVDDVLSMDALESDEEFGHIEASLKLCEGAHLIQQIA